MTTAQIEINRDLAVKVLSVVDAGLSSGLGKPKPGFLCVEAAVCYAMGLPHGDEPTCVAAAVRALKISLNDTEWSSKTARAKGLRRLAIAQLGSAGIVDDNAFAKRVAELAIRKCAPLALRAAASINKDPAHKKAMLDAANKCEVEGTRAAANAAANAAYAAAYAANAAAAANANANAAAAAAANAAYAAAANANAAAAAAANANANAAAAAAAYAAYAANAAANAAAKKKKRDEILSAFAEDVVQVLVAMGSPGCEWLDLTEAA